MGMVMGKINEEVPDHKVVFKGEGYEIWRYPSQVTATVYAKDLDANNPPTGEKFRSAAFRTLARYIGVLSKPENEKRGNEGEAGEPIAMTAPVVLTAPEKISMTAPVVMSNTAGESMTFMLPAKYKSVEEAPKPTNPAVKLALADSGRCDAVLQYSGGVEMENGKKRAEQLLDMMKKDGVEATGPFTVQGYNPPFTLPMFKRTEIHIPVDGSKYVDA